MRYAGIFLSKALVRLFVRSYWITPCKGINLRWDFFPLPSWSYSKHNFFSPSWLMPCLTWSMSMSLGRHESRIFCLFITELLKWIHPLPCPCWAVARKAQKTPVLSHRNDILMLAWCTGGISDMSHDQSRAVKSGLFRAVGWSALPAVRGVQPKLPLATEPSAGTFSAWEVELRQFRAMIEDKLAPTDLSLVSWTYKHHNVAN